MEDLDGEGGGKGALQRVQAWGNRMALSGRAGLPPMGAVVGAVNTQLNVQSMRLTRKLSRLAAKAKAMTGGKEGEESPGSQQQRLTLLMDPVPLDTSTPYKVKVSNHFNAFLDDTTLGLLMLSGACSPFLHPPLRSFSYLSLLHHRELVVL